MNVVYVSVCRVLWSDLADAGKNYRHIYDSTTA